MEYKTRGKESTSVGRGQKKENKSAEVNKTRGNEKNGKAEDVSNGFPNFNVLNAEEKLAFFEALSEARKNIEKQGLPTRERFGTVHDEYLEYFTKDEKKEKVEKKPESASSVRPSRSPTVVPKNKEKPPTEKVDREYAKQKFPHNKSYPKSPSKRYPLRPESAPVDKYDSIIKRETNEVVQMYLNKKKRIEEEWRRSSPMTVIPPPKMMVRKTSPKQTNLEMAKTTKKTGAYDTKAETSFKPIETQRFQSLNPTERKEFFRILKEAHDGILEKNPQTDIFSLDEILNAYNNSERVTTVCTAIKENKTKKKNLRVNLTITSGDNERLSRSKSQILSDSAREEINGRSKSLESLQSPDVLRGKQSKIPVLKKSQSETEECCDSDCTINTIELCQETNETPPTIEEKKKKELKEKSECRETVPYEKKRPEKKEEVETDVVCEKKVQDTNRMRKVGMVKVKTFGLEKKKSEYRRAQRERENRAAEAARKERELLRKKKMEEWRKRLYKRELMREEPLVNKEWNKTTLQTPDYRSKPIRVKKKVTPDKRVDKASIKSTINDDRECIKKRNKLVKDVLFDKTKIGDKWCCEEEKCVKKTPKADIIECPKMKEVEPEDECVTKEMEFLKYLQERRKKEMEEDKEAEKSLRQESTSESEEECSEDEEDLQPEKKLEEEEKEKKAREAAERCLRRKKLQELREQKAKEAEEKCLELRKKLEEELREQKAREAEDRCLRKKKLQELRERKAREAEQKARELEKECSELCKTMEEEKAREAKDRCLRRKKIQELREQKAREAEQKCSKKCKTEEEELLEQKIREAEERWLRRRKLQEQKAIEAEEKCSDLCGMLEEELQERRTREAQEICPEIHKEFTNEIERKIERDNVEKLMKESKKEDTKLREGTSKDSIEYYKRKKKECLKELQKKKEKEEEEECSKERAELQKKLAEVKKEEETCEQLGETLKLRKKDSCGDVEIFIAPEKNQESEETTTLMKQSCWESESSNEEDSCEECEKSFRRDSVKDESELCVGSYSSAGICACGHVDSESLETDSFGVLLSRGKSEPIVRTATQSVKSLGRTSLLEQKPEILSEGDMPTTTADKTVVIDKRVLDKVKNLVNYLENKVKPKESFHDEYVRLVLSYTEYLTKVTESLMQKDQRKLGQPVLSTYTAHEVHLNIDDQKKKPKEETKKIRLPRSVSDSQLPQHEIPTTSGVEKKSKEPVTRRDSSLDLLQLSDSDSSTNLPEEPPAFNPLLFKKAGIPMTKIRLLQDLLKGRAGYVEGSIDEFKIVHYPEPEFVPKEPQTAKELTEIEDDQGEKVIRMKFFKNLVKLCRCGRKELEEDAILENLKGEAVRVDTADEKKNPTSVTINQSTMEVLKAAERKKIIEKYFK